MSTDGLSLPPIHQMSSRLMPVVPPMTTETLRESLRATHSAQGFFIPIASSGLTLVLMCDRVITRAQHYYNERQDMRKQIQALQVTYLQTAANLRGMQAEAIANGSKTAAGLAVAAEAYETVAADLQKIAGDR